jgi:type II secretory pathway component PulF
LVRALETLVSSGTPLAAAFDTVEELSVSRRSRTLTTQVRQLVSEGKSLAQAFDESRAIPPAVIGLVRAGERTGRLHDALKEAAASVESELALRARLWRSLTYPLVLVVAGCLSLGLIMLVVLPRFVALLSDAGRALPPATRVLLATGEIARRVSPVAAGSGAVLAALCARWVRTDANWERYHGWLLRLPAVGYIRRGRATARLCRTLAAALRAGAPIMAAMQIARDSLDDRAVRARVADAVRTVAGGATLSAALAETRVLSRGTLPLIKLGESSGQLADMLFRAGHLAQADVERMVDRGVALIEPGLVLILGSLIAFVAAAMFQAVYSLGPAS